MNEQHPIENLMGTTMENLRNMADVNTIVGTPVTTPDGSTIIPISSVSYGFAAGGSDIPSKRTTETKGFFGGGSGGGITIKPVAFLCIKNDGSIQLINMDSERSDIEKISEAIPSAIDKIVETINKNKKEKDPDKKNRMSRKNSESMPDDPEI
ncbi:MAG: GerW family sporulation protein [Clostridia bacterium]|nr:GerW family sporulation protein [Clostridia bacterium]